MKIAYVTDLPLQPSGGGSYAVNWHAYRQLEKHFSDIKPIVIQPRVSAIEERWSQFKRKILRQPGNFAYFSQSTSKDNANRIAAAMPSDVDAVFYRAATRWRHCPKSQPYFVYLDVSFHTFFHNTFDIGDFDSRDLKRIWVEEARFLENAEHVFFESQWGLEKTRSAYELKGNHYEALGRGGVIEPPDKDLWHGQELNLVTIAMNFEQKGGDILLAAFERLRKKLPQIRWKILGGEPPSNAWKQFKEIEYVGTLRPDEPSELAQFRDILANAFLLIHPTREDTNPLVLTEAAYFGCPAISVRRFAIPELVLHEETGILLDPPVTPDSLAAAIEYLASDRERYLRMRTRARSFSTENCTWDVLGQCMAERIHSAIA